MEKLCDRCGEEVPKDDTLDSDFCPSCLAVFKDEEQYYLEQYHQEQLQVKEFWERCGFNSFPSQEQRYVSYPSRSLHSRYKTRDVLEYVSVTKWIYPEGHIRSSLPPIDLNNLKRYAFPELEAKGWYISMVRVEFENIWRVEIHNPATDKYVERKGEDLEDIVFWACSEVLGGEDGL